MTPLKKRMLRHSLAEEGSFGGSSPKHEPRTAQDSLPAPATPTPVNQDAPPSEEPPILIQAKAELEPVQEEVCILVYSWTFCWKASLSLWEREGENLRVFLHFEHHFCLCLS